MIAFQAKMTGAMGGLGGLNAASRLPTADPDMLDVVEQVTLTLTLALTSP